MLEMKNFGCLQAQTRKILDDLVLNAAFLKNYCFVGGSALALHLCHRNSEDLDFFTYDKSLFQKLEILRFIERYVNKEILNENSEQIDLLIEGIKITFFNAGWSFLRPKNVYAFNLAELEAIAAMKINVLFVRAKFRDYYDLYSLSKELSLSKIFEISKNIVPGLTFKLFCTALLYIDDIEDDSINHLMPKEKISKRDIRKYFETLILKETENTL